MCFIFDLMLHAKGSNSFDSSKNALAVLEERIREKIDVGPSRTGAGLINYAFHPKNGKLTLGETESERESFFFIFRGTLGFLRNPPAHRFTEEESSIEAPGVTVG